MKYHRLIYKRKISVIGLMMFIIIFSFDMLYKVTKWFVVNIYKLTRWIIRYYRFVKSGYSYKEVYNLIYNMGSREFEIFIAELFKALGFKAKLTPPSNDYGRDVILITEKGQIFIECKRYSAHNFVGREICTKLLGSMQMLGAYKGIVITTGKLHKNALEVASKVDNLELWDISDIMKAVSKVNQNLIPKILTKSIEHNKSIMRLNPINSR